MGWEYMLSILGTVCAIVFGYFAFARNKRKDEQRDTTNTATISSDIGYIKAGNDDIKLKLEKLDEKQEKQHLQMAERMTMVEASAKQAHKRVDDVKTEINDIKNELKEIK